MKREVSAGGVVVTKTKTGWYVLLIEDMKGNWTFPKGLVETGETAEEAAKREVAEETGISESLELLRPLSPVEYYYYRTGTIKKTVNYFLFCVRRRVRIKTQKEEGINRGMWVPLAMAVGRVDYKETNVPILKEAVGALR